MLHSTTLLITQDASLVNAVSEVIQSIRGFRLAVVPDIEMACNEILEHDEIVVTLVHLDGKTNVSGLTRVLQVDAPDRRPMVTIVISEHDHPEQTLIFSRLGVAECMSRPLDLSRLSYLIDVLTIETRYGLPSRPRIVEPDLGEVRSLGDEPPFFFLPAGRMGRVIEQIKRIAPLDTTVMIGGETGTGKTHMAGMIHRLSPRRDQPFLTINCGALAANLIESEMFGHARGAFTGADAERTGKFAAVGRGTLFLDEIDLLPPELQAKLLRVVEERVFEAVGSNKTLRLQARLIVASNRPLEREVAAGRFRSDLFYRINVVAFDIPPLRERIAVLPALARAQLADHAARNGRRVNGIAPAAMQAMLAYAWPGNVRELRNVIERAVALGHGSMIELDDLPERLHTAVAAVAMTPAPVAAPAASPVSAPAASPSDFLAALSVSVAVPDMGPQAPQGRLTAARSTLAEAQDQTERALITQALERNSYNRLRAAADLGVSRMTLYKKLHKYGLMGTS
jgi:DNA-binding NtrC family response regulator